jgi:SAM-dependent methyltransferase
MREVYAGRFRQHPMVSVVEGSALAIPSGDGEFDLALSNLVLHHVPPGDRDRCAAELARVLKPGGTLIYGDMFCDVDGPPEDPARCRDIIDKMVAAALYCLDQGAYEMMMIMLKTLPMDLREEGEHLTTESVWLGSLERAGFGGFEIVRVPPEEAGVRIIRATSGV